MRGESVASSRGDQTVVGVAVKCDIDTGEIGDLSATASFAIGNARGDSVACPEQ